MPTLKIDIPSMQPDETDTTVDEIRVTHFVARDIRVNQLKQTDGTTHGIIVLLPQVASFTLAVGGKPVFMAPGLAYICRGEDERRLLDSPSTHQATVHVMELNAVINGGIFVGELLSSTMDMAPSVYDEVERLFHELTAVRRPITLPNGSTDIARHLSMMRLVTLILDSLEINASKDGYHGINPDLLKLKTFMARNLGTNPSVEDMARHMGMSRSAFYRWAKPLLNESPITYLRGLRLDRCRELLRTTDMTLEEIATETAFCSRHHLTREFSRRYGRTPIQLRRATKAGPDDDGADAIETLVLTRQYEKALAACNTSLQRAGESLPEKDRVLGQKARCLYALGQLNTATSLWNSLCDSSEAFDAHRQLCTHSFRIGKYDNTLSHFSSAYAYANSEQQRELILVWCHQVAELINKQIRRPLGDYLEARRNLFPDDERSTPLTLDLLVGLGQEHLVVEECANLKDRCLYSMRRAGMHREALERFGPILEPDAIATTLILAGCYDEVIDMANAEEGEKLSSYVAVALARSGRAEEAIERYPKHSMEAYLSLGRYQELVDRFPEPSLGRFQALYRLNRVTDLIQLTCDNPFLQESARYYAGPEYVASLPQLSALDYRHAASLQMALRALLADDLDDANRYLGMVPKASSPEFWWKDCSGPVVFLSAITYGLTGDTGLMQRELRAVFNKYRFCDWQKVWHDVAYVLGEIDERAYRKQPCRGFLEDRLALAKACVNDLAGDLDGAIAGYLTVGRYPVSPPLDDFIAWRQSVADGR